ncbi:hypothetical protein ABZ896_22210 [Streptomyces sp. NPDC047072]|uniref:hypothetical protein n=1 Tax=Streptomyces sp. NPDC047072 TaxID=3154809 RepID=UPI0033CC519D
MAQLLGSLELVGDRWIIGDPKRGKGSCVVLTPDGMEHHERGTTEPLSAVPWSRVVHTRVKGSASRWQNTRTAAFANAFASGHVESGPKACLLGAYLRYPAAGWTVLYDRHERSYTYMHLFLLDDLFRKVSDAKAVHLLGDPDWLAGVVAKLAPTPTWTPLPGRHVTALLKELGVM